MTPRISNPLLEPAAPAVDCKCLRTEFSEAAQVQLMILIGAISVWNWLQVGLRAAQLVANSRAAT